MKATKLKKINAHIGFINLLVKINIVEDDLTGIYVKSHMIRKYSGQRMSEHPHTTSLKDRENQKVVSDFLKVLYLKLIGRPWPEFYELMSVYNGW